MGILDDAIREHLELKRQHGAGDPELKQLEDEAFGPPERPGGGETPPDPFAEAPTEFMAAPEATEEQAPAQSRRESPGIADLQEAPPPAEPAQEKPAEVEPADEEQPAMEHEVVPEPPQPGGHSTEERHAIAEQPTEMFDVEGEIAASDSSSPSNEELVEEEIGEPRLAPVDPLAGLESIEAEAEIEVSATADEAAEDDEDDAFWDEQRLSDELNQALEAPMEENEEPEAGAEVEEEEVEEPDEADEEEVVENLAVEDEDEGEPGEEPVGAPSPDREDDVLEGTPDFLEDSEDDELWFEQKPPKDFDFDD